MTDADHTVVTKQCTKCGEVKKSSEFYRRSCEKDGLDPKCKLCKSAYVKKHRMGNAEYANRCNERAKKWREDNREKSLKRSREYHMENRDARNALSRKWKADNAERNKLITSRWRKDNHKKVIAYAREYQLARRRDCPAFDMQRRIQIQLSNCMRSGGYTKKSRTQEILGCDWDFFKAHIERQFLKGMSWDNRSEWHIDHIVPMASAKTEEDVIRLNHFTNLRPLWAKDNIAKGDRITHLI